MIDIFDAESDALIGTITEAELEYLKEVLEEESLDDKDYFFTADTIDLLTEDGQATDHLLEVLRKGLGTEDSVELRWEHR
ncbi:MAG: galactosyldiacylglycerol synthase [Gemmatimonadota bacterium]